MRDPQPNCSVCQREGGDTVWVSGLPDEPGMVLFTVGQERFRVSVLHLQYGIWNVLMGVERLKASRGERPFPIEPMMFYPVKPIQGSGG
jgi:hypothetical protein